MGAFSQLLLGGMRVAAGVRRDPPPLQHTRVPLTLGYERDCTCSTWGCISSSEATSERLALCL